MLFFVMMKENFHELPAMIEMAHSLGINQVVAKNLDVILKEGDDARRIFRHPEEGEINSQISQVVEEARQKAKKFKIPLRVYALSPAEKPICEQDPLDTLFVAWDGSMSPCINLSYIQNRCFGGRWHTAPVVRFGNMSSEPLEVIWEKPDYRHFRERFQKRLNLHNRNLMDFLTSDQRYKEVRDWPPPPEGCKHCYYLYEI
jgi:MoaA/NifB/PqqE/SkfB family radical SAM enzyme